MLRPALACVLAAFSTVPFAPPAKAASLPPQSGTASRLADGDSGATAEELIERGDELRAEKAFSSALDYYESALPRTANTASLRNRIAIVEMELGHWKRSMHELDLAIRTDPNFADAYNNLAVDYYEVKNFRRAINLYKKAISLGGEDASFYSNLGAAYFSRRQFDKAADAYRHAFQIDPEVLEHSSRTGVSARLPSPNDRARFDYDMAKLYAKMGSADHCLEHLRRALEEGYKHISDAYTDEEFAGLRKDPRFLQLMTKRPASIAE